MDTAKRGSTRVYWLRRGCGDPGGIRTRDLDLERVASWARLDDGVSRLSITADSARRMYRGMDLDGLAGLITAAGGNPDSDGPSRRLDGQAPGRVHFEQSSAHHRVFAGLTRRRGRWLQRRSSRRVAQGGRYHRLDAHLHE